jgi:hypothetical protein
MDLQERAAAVANVAHYSYDGLTNRIRQEFLEMPGLALTEIQAQRLWNLDSRVCEAVLAALVSEQFLARSRGGAYLRRTAR